MITLNHITKIFKDDPERKKILNEITLKIKKGEFIAVMGPSGSGKSTLMNIIGLLDKPTRGSYVLDGEAIDHKIKSAQLAYLRRQKIGFVFQSFNLVPRMTALANVELPMVYSRYPARKNRARELLEKVGLGHRLSYLPNKLSGGEQQRVAIARALANNPAILLADEPTGNLDSRTGKRIMDLLDKLNREGLTIIMVTHEHDIAAYANRIIKLKDGRIVNHGKRKA